MRSPARSPSSHAKARTRTTKAETREGGTGPARHPRRGASLPFSPRPERREGALLAEGGGDCNPAPQRFERRSLIARLQIVLVTRLCGSDSQPFFVQEHLSPS